LKELREAFAAYPVAVLGGPPALPHDRIVNRLARLAIPEDRRLPLIRDAEGSDLVGPDVVLGQDAVGRAQLRIPDVFGSMLDPAGLRVELLEFLLGYGERLPGPVKQDGARTGGALIQRKYEILPHVVLRRILMDLFYDATSYHNAELFLQARA
jgi:hypothetical protein